MVPLAAANSLLLRSLFLMVYLCLHQNFECIELLLVSGGESFFQKLPFEKGNLTKILTKELIPAILNLCEKGNLSLKDVTHIVCTQGPGSFTGLRITLSTLQGIATAISAKIFVTTTLHILAFKSRKSPVIVSMSNEKGGHFTQSFEMQDNLPLALDDIHMTEEPSFLGDVSVHDLFDYASKINDWGGVERLSPVYGHTPTFRKKSQ